MVKKMPALMAETQFDADNNVKMVLGANTPKYIRKVFFTVLNGRYSSSYDITWLTKYWAI